VIIVAFGIYLSIGFFLAGSYLRQESMTFECPQSDGQVITVFYSNAPVHMQDCESRISFANSAPTAAILFLLWLPLLVQKIAGNIINPPVEAFPLSMNQCGGNDTMVGARC